MKIKIFLLVALIIFTACATDQAVVQTFVAQTVVAFTPVPSEKPFSTQTSYPTYTFAPTSSPVVLVVTITPTETPLYTPTVTPLPSETLDQTLSEKSPGFYLVGSEIAAGLWRSTGKGDNCYWEVANREGDTMDNYFGVGGITMYIPVSGFSVQMDAPCGNWVFMGQ